MAVCARANRFTGEIPHDSLVGVFCMPSKRPHKELGHSDLHLNVVGVAMIATPYGQSTGTFD